MTTPASAPFWPDTVPTMLTGPVPTTSADGLSAAGVVASDLLQPTAGARNNPQATATKILDDIAVPPG
jgi:hypothetical protein